MADSIRQERIAAVGARLATLSGIVGTPIYGEPVSTAPAAAKPAGTVYYWDAGANYDNKQYQASDRLIAILQVGVMMTFAHTEDTPHARGNQLLPLIEEKMREDETWGGAIRTMDLTQDAITPLATDTHKKLGAVWTGWELSYFRSRTDPYEH